MIKGEKICNYQSPAIIYLVDSFFILGILIIYCTKSITSSKRNNSKNGEVDEFINKLLSSKKFDELTEKIAEKAVQRIQSLDKVGHKILRENTKEGYVVDDGDDVDFKEDGLSKEKRRKVNNFIKQREPVTTFKTDTEVFFLRDLPRPHEKLQLKYKSLIRGNMDKAIKKREPVHSERQSSTQTNPQLKTSTKNYVIKERSVKNYKSKIKVEEKELENEIKETLDNIAENDNPENIQIYMKSNVKAEQSHLASDRETKAVYRYSKEKESNSQAQEENDSQISEESSYVYTDQQNIEVSDSEEEAIPKYNETQDVIKHKLNIESTTNYRLEDIHYKETEALHDSDSNKEDKQTFKQSSEIHENTESIENRANNEMHEVIAGKGENAVQPRIRKEGNKIYTFERLPDYDEYHENVDNLNRTKNISLST